MTGFIAAVAEAWDEVRVHRSRFALSVVGVFLAVFTMTTVHAFGSIGVHLMQLEMERNSGRPGTISLSMPTNGGQDSAKDIPKQVAAAREYVDRMGASHASMKLEGDMARVRMGSNQLDHVNTMAVDPSYLTITRHHMVSGRWFKPSDVDQLSLQMVVSPAMAKDLGISQPMPQPYPVTIQGKTDIAATVIGVYSGPKEWPEAMLLADQVVAKDVPLEVYQSALYLWMPPEAADQLYNLDSGRQPEVWLNADTKAVVAPQFMDDIKFFSDIVPWIIRGLGLFALGLASLGVINVGIVTVRTRIREIGVRRSFGAPTSQVFAAIMLESVVASLIAGALGVLAAVAVLRSPWVYFVQDYINVQDIPPFPLPVAIEGLMWATLVGALAGLIPAVIAVRAKVIEAIRF